MKRRFRHARACASVLALWAGVGVGVAGCGTDARAPRVAGETGAAETGELPIEAHPAAELAEAQKAQFEVLLEPAEAFLVAVDPIAAASIGKAELATPPVTIDERQAIAAKLEAAEHEAADLDLDLLPADAATGLRGIRFALDRERDAMRRQPSGRSDPTHLPHQMLRLLDEIEWRLLTGGNCGACGRVLERAAVVLDEGAKDLTAFSSAGIAGGLTALSTLEARARALAADPDLAPSAEKLAAAAANEREALAARLETLPAEPDGRWEDPAPLRGSQVTRRLPDELGLIALRRRLGVEEGIAAEPRALFDGVTANLDRYAAMQTQVPPAPKAVPTPLTAERCQARWDELSSRVAKLEVLPPPARLDCGQLATLRPAAIDDADLDLLLMDFGLIEADRRAFRLSQTPTVALVGGRLGPPAQMHIRRVSYAAALGLKPAAARAMQRGEQDLCRAGVALWVHAKLGEPAELDAWVAKHCGDEDADTLRQLARENPRQALRGLLLGTLTSQPADMVRIDRFWWAPASQQRLLANPQVRRPPRTSGPVAVEEIPIDKLVDPDFVPSTEAPPPTEKGDGAPTP